MNQRTTQEIEIRLPPEEAESGSAQKAALAKKLSVPAVDIKGFSLRKRSIDARGRNVFYLLRFVVSLEGPVPSVEPFELTLGDVSRSEPVIVVGFGPAGMFAALKLIELGYKPIVFERGKNVRERRHDIAAINKRGIVDPESNYCFGEGGAGTFSDGKLYTRSTKRGSVTRILQLLVAHGASPDILIDAHPHIGTNRLPALVQAIRERIVSHGGEVHFGKRVVDLLGAPSQVQGVRLADGTSVDARAVVLATGHSARDIFELLSRKEIFIESKPFAIGVRVEHPQALIDEIQYHSAPRSPYLPAASYSLVSDSTGRGVFSFCMCPGGIICPAATANDEIVVNGWSPSKRNSYFANSGIVTEVRLPDLKEFQNDAALAGIALQRTLEEKAFELGGGAQRAPAQRLVDFLAGKNSATLPKTSYLPGVSSANLQNLFSTSLYRHLKSGFEAFGKKRKGYISDEAVLLAVESRTSSPVKIPRDRSNFMHPGVAGLFPAGEGPGYAGGIMSAAMDGENVAEGVNHYLRG